MKRLFGLIILLLVCDLAAVAQSSNQPKPPRFEFFIGQTRDLLNNGVCGVSVITGTVPPHCILSEGTLLKSEADRLRPTVATNGVELSAKLNINRYVGLRSDFSAQLTKRLIVRTNGAELSEMIVDTRLYQYMAGPEVRIGDGRAFSPFGYALVGHAHCDNTIATLISQSRYTFGVGTLKTEGLSSAFGGGLDLRVSDRASLRYAVDFNSTRARAFSLDDQSQNNIRTSIGILFR